MGGMLIFFGGIHMKKAAVDIGTNSTRLYIADVGERIKRIEKYTEITRLGKDVDREKRLKNAGIQKNIEVLLKYKEIAASYGIKDIIAIATSAVRDASNRDEFVKLIMEKTGIEIKIISGREEAELGFLGASSMLDGGSGTVCDIGGGSTELIFGRGRSVELAESVDIGAVRITERFLNPERVSELEIESAYSYIRKVISPVAERINKNGRFGLVGIGGTATTLAAIDQELQKYEIEKVHGYELGKKNIDAIFNNLKDMSLEEKRNIPGLQRERADIITAGTLILKTVMEEMGSSCIIISEFDNLDGAIMKYGM